MFKKPFCISLNGIFSFLSDEMLFCPLFIFMQILLKKIAIEIVTWRFHFIQCVLEDTFFWYGWRKKSHKNAETMNEQASKLGLDHRTIKYS